MTKRMALGIGLSAALALLSACSSGAPGEAACQGVAGTYVAQFRSPCVSFGVDSVTLNQNGCHLTGGTSSAMIEGNLNGDSATFKITFLGACSGTASGSATFVGNTANGSFQGRPSPGSTCCKGDITGTFILTR